MLLLVVAYRSLGGNQQQQVDPAALLTSAATALDASLAGLAARSGPDAHVPRSPGAEAGQRDGRRSSSAAQHYLDQMPSDSDLDDAQATARALLTAAAEDASWAWRMLATDPVSTGVTIAVSALHDHAADCSRQAAALLSRAE